MRSCAAFKKRLYAPEKELQHKSLLLFAVKKVIVAKVKLCGNRLNDHVGPPCTVAIVIISLGIA